MSLIDDWVGKRITIATSNASVLLIRNNNDTNASTTSVVSTGRGWTDQPCVFVVERAPSSHVSSRNLVAFRVDGTQKYLTIVLYGDEEKNKMADALASLPMLVADVIPSIVDYAVGGTTDGTNFEGTGFNYSPMTAQLGPPNRLQVFQLERAGHCEIGIKSLFGTYWRHQWWDSVVSQSGHCQGDEQFSFEIAPS